ncbi:MAG: hypothetical protein Q4D51_03615 [Eubacteriales bacterium]|nr:hypothetical protein [Eubacteriales bacterium]
MKRRLKMRKLNNSGSAMIMAMVVGVIILAFCLSMLMVSYSVMMNAANQRISLQCKEYAKSVSKEVERSILNGDKNDEIWMFLRYNIRQESWPYYKAGEADHEKNQAYRYFELTCDGEETPNGNIKAKVILYWEPEEGLVEDGDTVATLHAQVIAGIGDAIDTTKVENLQDTSYTLGTVYELTIRKEDPSESDLDPSEDGGSEPELEVCPDEEYNSFGNSIQVDEIWKWDLKERV